MSVVWSILYVVYMGIMLAGYTTMCGRVAATMSCICLWATFFCLGYIVGKEKRYRSLSSAAIFQNVGNSNALFFVVGTASRPATNGTNIIRL